MFYNRRYNQFITNLFRLTLIALLIVTTVCWNQWEYSTQWNTDPTSAAQSQAGWDSVWSTGYTYRGNSAAPRPRRGHSLHILKTDERSDYYNGDTFIFMFGGRDNDQVKTHIPRTYNIKSINGTIVFTTYDERPVNACDDPNNEYYTPAEQTGCNFTSASKAGVGLFYNDVWAYRLCSQTSQPAERGFDTACENSGWILIHPGAPEGGCVYELGTQVCTSPSERYNHGSALFSDGCLYVYGGFSQRCTDFCDDVWFFDVYLKSWRQVYAAGQLTNFYTDLLFLVNVTVNPIDVPIDNTSSRFAGPGRRWRHSMVLGKQFLDPSDGLKKQQVAIYGGHRLWQGYSAENSQDNNWEDYTTRPVGGYLNDLWIYTKYLDFNTFPGAGYHTSNGYWKLKQPGERCYSNPGLAWAERNLISCFTLRPSGRVGHGSAFDSDRNIVWLFGGYNTYYPYPKTDGIGSGAGVSAVGAGGFVPYPGYRYFLNDLWYYNLTDSLWYEIVLAEGSPIPDPRMEAVFLLLGDVIFVHGGFSDNYIYGDTWYYNITTKRWLEKTAFVRPIYPGNCTDDFEYIEKNNCTALFWPLHLERDTYYPYNPLPYSEQKYYWPDSSYGPYFGVLPKGMTHKGDVDTWNMSLAPEGTPLFPYDATGVMQYSKIYVYPYNSTHNVSLVESCMSTFGEPTRGKVTDGQYGRSSGPVLIGQPRPRKPGWDGCRDRFDYRTDLPPGLQYVKPLPRFGHRAIFHENTSEIIMYGGMAYIVEAPKSLNNSYPQQVLSDMWYYSLNHCVNNCSFNGDCYYGFCFCYVGYYGVDCSNVSCPGTYCYYDELSHEQICSHACQAGYSHQDGELYVQDIAKVPCSSNHAGESNGVCNGFGTTMCAPPFIGDDCGTKDCPYNCSFNGWCSVEFPVSRCNCQPGYFGEYCESMICLNNCSYPNGVCNTTSGICKCNMMYSPYNNTRSFVPWQGEDCSFLHPYEAGFTRAVRFNHMILVWFVVVFVSVLLMSHNSTPDSAENKIDRTFKSYKIS